MSFNWFKGLRKHWRAGKCRKKVHGIEQIDNKNLEDQYSTKQKKEYLEYQDEAEKFAQEVCQKS